MAIYYAKKGEFRLYDGGATKKYIIVKFSNMDLNGPEGANRPEEKLKLNRAVLDTAASYIQGPDDPVTDGLPLTMSYLLDSASKELIQEFIGLRFASGQDVTWNAGSGDTALVTTKGLSVGRPAGLTGSLVVLPLFTDPKKVCVNVEAIWSSASGDVGRRWSEVYFRPGEQTFNESMDGISINMNGQVFGYIESITTFSAGTLLT